MSLKRKLHIVFGFAAWCLILMTGVEFCRGGWYPTFGATLIGAGFCGVIAWMLGNL